MDPSAPDLKPPSTPPNNAGIFALHPELIEWTRTRESQGDVVGRVTRVDRGEFDLALVKGSSFSAERRFAFSGIAPVAVGDWIAAGADQANTSSIEVFERWSLLARRAAGEATIAQELATNVDVVMCVHALTTAVNLRRIERELVVARSAPAIPIVILTKNDLAIQKEVERTIGHIQSIDDDAAVIVTSSKFNEVAECYEYLVPGATGVMVGSSGVGKSSLINSLVQSEVQSTGEVRHADQKGRHTTTARQMVMLPNDACIIDTPGLRSMGLWEANGGLEETFAEITKAAQECKFRDCQHQQEPGCAVKAGVEAGAIRSSRLNSFHNLRGELESLAVARDQQRWRSKTR